MNIIAVLVYGFNNASCGQIIERRLRALPGVLRVDASYVSHTVIISYDTGRMHEETIRDLVKDCGFACSQPMTASHLLRGAAEAKRAGIPVSLERATADVTTVEPPAVAQAPADVAPGSEPRSVQAPAVHTHPAHAAIGMNMGMEHDERAEHRHGGHRGRGGTTHDVHGMSDPAMAAAMEADMRARLFVALVVAIPIVLYSSLGTSLFHLHLPTPLGVFANWLQLALATTVVLWAGWIFHVGARRAPCKRTLDMNVLAGLGVLVAYLFSALATLFAPQVETSLDAAAVLVIFVLFGRWMEVRRRRGSSDALNALLRRWRCPSHQGLGWRAV